MIPNAWRSCGGVRRFGPAGMLTPWREGAAQGHGFVQHTVVLGRGGDGGDTPRGASAVHVDDYAVGYGPSVNVRA